MQRDCVHSDEKRASLISGRRTVASNGAAFFGALGELSATRKVPPGIRQPDYSLQVVNALIVEVHHPPVGLTLTPMTCPPAGLPAESTHRP